MYLDTLALGEGHPGLILADDEDVAEAGGESGVNGILDVDDVETTIVALAVGDNTNATHVATTGNHGDGTGIETDGVGDLASGEVDLDGVVDTDAGVGVANGASIVRDEVGDALLSKLHLLDLAELVLGLGVGDAVDGEATLGVVVRSRPLSCSA